MAEVFVVGKCPHGHKGCREYRQEQYDWRMQQASLDPKGIYGDPWKWLLERFEVTEEAMACDMDAMLELARSNPKDALKMAVLVGVWLEQRQQARREQADLSRLESL